VARAAREPITHTQESPQVIEVPWHNKRQTGHTLPFRGCLTSWLTHPVFVERVWCERKLDQRTNADGEHKVKRTEGVEVCGGNRQENPVVHARAYSNESGVNTVSAQPLSILLQLRYLGN